MFRGVTHLALDNKGRLAIPAKHRDALAHHGEGRLVLTADPSHCLLLYPAPRVGADPAAPDGAVELQRKNPRPAAAARRSRRRRRCSTARVAFWFRRRCDSTPRSTSTSCSSARATSSSSGTKRNGWSAPRKRSRFPPAVCRPSSTASRSDGRWQPSPGPAPRSRGRAGDQVRGHLRRRDLRSRWAQPPRFSSARAHSGRLIALDRDPAAEAEARAWSDPRFHFRRAWFSEFPQVLDDEGIATIDGVLARPRRLLAADRRSPRADFRFRADGPLDMRMDPTRGQRARRNGLRPRPSVNSGG